MAATEQEMMERAARIQTIEELREACAEFGVEMSPEDEQAFMAAKAELRELSEGELDASVGGSGFFGPGSPYINLFDTCDQWDGWDFDNRICATCRNKQMLYPLFTCQLLTQRLFLPFIPLPVQAEKRLIVSREGEGRRGGVRM